MPLAQSDEDRILGLDAPAPSEDGIFTALQVELELGSAVYATMALREVTKTETSAHYQSSLTQASEDQAHRGVAAAAAADVGAKNVEGEDAMDVSDSNPILNA